MIYEHLFTVGRGKHNYRPDPAPQFMPLKLVYGSPYQVKCTAILHEDSWYDPTLARCGESRNKIWGVGKFWSQNNRNAALFAWFPSTEKNRFWATIYLNDDKGRWKEYGDKILFEAGHPVSMTWNVEKGFEIVVVKLKNELTGEFTGYDFPSWPGEHRQRGAYFGGRCFSTQERTMFLKIEVNGTD